MDVKTIVDAGPLIGWLNAADYSDIGFSPDGTKPQLKPVKGVAVGAIKTFARQVGDKALPDERRAGDLPAKVRLKLERKQLLHPLTDEPPPFFANHAAPLPQAGFRDEMQRVHPAECLPIQAVRSVEDHFRWLRLTLQRSPQRSARPLGIPATLAADKGVFQRLVTPHRLLPKLRPGVVLTAICRNLRSYSGLVRSFT